MPPQEPDRWNQRSHRRNQRLARAAQALGPALRGKQVDTAAIGRLFDAVIEPGDRVCLEANNQKQADFLARALAKVDPQRINNLHMLQSVLALPEHLDLFDDGIASRLDFSFSGPQGARLAQLGMSPVGSTPAELAASIAAYRVTVAEIIRAEGIRVE